MEMGIITNEEVKETLENIGWKTLIGEIRKGFIEENVSPPKIYLNTEMSDMRCMPAYLPKYNPYYCGVKIICVAPQNPKVGLPTVLGEYLLRDAKTQQLLVTIEAEELTAYRTAAATGVATEVLSNYNSKTLGIIGAGKQAFYQIRAILAVRPSINVIKIYDIVKSQAQKTEELVCRYLWGVNTKIVGLEEALDSDIVTTLTPAETPFISATMIKPGTHINAVGADSKSKIEFWLEILGKSRIIVDDFLQCSHSGEIYRGLKYGHIKESDLIPLGNVLLNKVTGRKSNNNITFFKSTGVAFEDLITAILIYENLK